MALTIVTTRHVSTQDPYPDRSMKALEVVDAMARWIIVHGEARQTCDSAADTVSASGACSQRVAETDIIVAKLAIRISAVVRRSWFCLCASILAYVTEPNCAG